MKLRSLLINIILTSVFIPYGNAGSIFTRGTVKVNGGTLFFETLGKGPPLVFIHGGQMDRRMWDPQTGTFEDSYKIIRYDVRGYGKSTKPERPFSHVDDLYLLLKHLKIQKATLIGLSLGGIIATDFSIVHPEMVDLLILAGPGLSGYQESPETGAAIWAIIEAARDSGFDKAAELWTKDPYMIPAMENRLCRENVKIIVKDNAYCWLNNPLLERGIKPPAIERLSEIKPATLLIVGDRDVKDIQIIVDTLVKSIIGAKKKIIHGAGHIVNMENPEEFNKILLEFLETNIRKR